MKLRIGLLVLALVLALASVGFAAQKTLRVGTEATFRPFEFQNDQGEYLGFDMDLIRAIVKNMNEKQNMNVKLEIINTAFDGLLPQLMAGEFDLIIAAVTITPERAESVDFSEGYFNAGQVVVVAKNNNTIKSYKDLTGKKVAVQIGTTGDLETSKMPGVQVVRFNTIPEAFTDVYNGGADAAVADLQVAVEFVKEHPEMAKIVGDVFTEEYYGIAVRKGNKELLNAINTALNDLKADGTYQKIWDTWFGTN